MVSALSLGVPISLALPDALDSATEVSRSTKHPVVQIAADHEERDQCSTGCDKSSVFPTNVGDQDTGKHHLHRRGKRDGKRVEQRTTGSCEKLACSYHSSRT